MGVKRVILFSDTKTSTLMWRGNPKDDGSSAALDIYHKIVSTKPASLGFKARSTSSLGTTVAEKLDFSPPTNANWFQSPAGLLLDFSMWESCRTMPLVCKFSRGPSIPALLNTHLNHLHWFAVLPSVELSRCPAASRLSCATSRATERRLPIVLVKKAGSSRPPSTRKVFVSFALALSGWKNTRPREEDNNRDNSSEQLVKYISSYVLSGQKSVSTFTEVVRQAESMVSTTMVSVKLRFVRNKHSIKANTFNIPIPDAQQRNWISNESLTQAHYRMQDSAPVQCLRVEAIRELMRISRSPLALPRASFFNQAATLSGAEERVYSTDLAGCAQPVSVSQHRSFPANTTSRRGFDLSRVRGSKRYRAVSGRTRAARRVAEFQPVRARVGDAEEEEEEEEAAWRCCCCALLLAARRKKSVRAQAISRSRARDIGIASSPACRPAAAVAASLPTGRPSDIPAPCVCNFVFKRDHVSCPVAPSSSPIRDRMILIPNQDPV
ncbi:hypothetical protein PR048_002985 [Dryococelus australis]|uniref:Uncharacterized protein n=1 Tax=Dryococelus australis TaxID=614101 RepID=A0ABQ9IMT2_9NEOP|nr:hypothetical protein PR048_002985 [Dryococelus australis]